jgi:MerR family transcriptional regulator, light-induced transcriptional regulator
MAIYNIRELENLSGIKAHTIRIWEKRFGLITPQRTSTNIRTYSDAELKKLLNISLLNRNGIKISAIAKYSDSELIEKISEINRENASPENQSDALSMAMIDYNEYMFEQVLAKSVIRLGFEETIVKVVYPFLVKIGLMWQTGKIIPAQEHFTTNLIRQKLISAIDNIVAPDPITTKKFVFFLPEGEFHEIGLLFYCYLVKKRGHSVIYLGQSMPLNDVFDVADSKGMDYLVTTMPSKISNVRAEDYLNMIADRINEKTLFISGAGINLPETLSGNIRLISSPEEFQYQLDHLNLLTGSRYQKNIIKDKIHG